jgi:alpha-L-fucosidase
VKRRSFLKLSASALAACATPRNVTSGPGDSPQSLPRPSTSQLAWQRDELALFFHFGVNTFTDREWGDGRESPSIFAPANLDTRQWARAARSAGARSMILTAKHHDGFCLWPTRTTEHSVARSPWKGGRGDVVREFVDACRDEGMRPGLYLSPWDRNNPSYGNSEKYNDLYCDQLTELLTRYGQIAEVWFDGANGEGPNGKRQVYDWPRVFSLVRRLQPGAVMFSDAGPDVRWCGNESGTAGDPNWSMVDPDAVPYPGADGPGITNALQHGSPTGSVWRPAECDVSIRPGWFSHPADDAKLRSVDNLVGLYFSSVGRNGKLLLNVPPMRNGLLHAVDVARLTGFRQQLTSMFERDLAREAKSTWRVDGRTAIAEFTLPRSSSVTIVRLEEDITRGQRVSNYSVWGEVGGEWKALSRGTTIGYAKLDRFLPAQTAKLRVAIEDSIAAPQEIGVKVYGPA